MPFCFHTFVPIKRNMSFAGFRLSRAVFGLSYVILVLIDSKNLKIEITKFSK